MSQRSLVLLRALTAEPVTTSELYARVGYIALTQVGLVPYDTFRAELVKLSAARQVVECGTADDGSTLWRLASGADTPAD